MYRRIEFIHELSPDPGEVVPLTIKCGIMGVSHADVVDAWIDKLRGPLRSGLPRNCLFYFTEKGWEEVGRHVITACQRVKQRYRVIAVKHKAVSVCWRDRHTGFEVAVQPLRKR